MKVKNQKQNKKTTMRIKVWNVVISSIIAVIILGTAPVCLSAPQPVVNSVFTETSLFDPQTFATNYQEKLGKVLTALALPSDIKLNPQYFPDPKAKLLDTKSLALGKFVFEPKVAGAESSLPGSGFNVFYRIYIYFSFILIAFIPLYYWLKKKKNKVLSWLASGVSAFVLFIERLFARPHTKDLPSGALESLSSFGVGVKKLAGNKWRASLFLGVCIFLIILLAFPAADEKKTAGEIFTQAYNALFQPEEDLSASLENSQAELAQDISETEDNLNNSIIQSNQELAEALANDINEKLDLTGGTLSGNLLINGELSVADSAYFQDIYPESDDKYDLGSTSKQWSHIYVQHIYGSPYVVIGNASSGHALEGRDDLLVSGKLEVNEEAYFDAEVTVSDTLNANGLIDLGINTIADGNFTGDWDFNGGILIDIDALTAATGNITTANVTTLDLGTNTITDENLIGNWDFNSGDLTDIGTIASGAITATGHILPGTDSLYNLGASGTEWANLYIDNIVAGTMSLSGNLDMQNNLILNIGNAGTDFTATGGLNLAGNLDVEGLVNDIAGALTVNQLLTGNLGLTVSGAAINLNNNSNFTTNINTGTSSGAVNIGGNLNTVAIDSVDWNIGTTGAITNATYEGLTITPTTGTLTLTNGKTLAVSDSATLATNTLTLGNGKILTLSDSATLNTNAITFAGTEILTLAAAKNVTFADAFTTSGAFPITLTATNTTNVTLPTSGTLATLAGAETFTNKVSYNGLVITANTGAITTGSWHGTVIDADHGGTGQTVYAVGDLLYANTTTTLARLADIAAGNVLISGGVATAPGWGKVDLTSHISGTLLVGNGGTGTATFTKGVLVSPGTTTAFTTLAGTDNYVPKWTSSGYLATTSLIYDDGTNVGIGTTTPGATLEIYSAANKIKLSYDDTNYSSFSTESNGDLAFLSSNVTEAALVLGSGTAGQDVSLQFDEESQDYYMGVDNTDHLLKIGLGLVIGTTPHFTMNTSGNVGIGTTSPTQKLTVAGSINVVGGSFIDDGTTLNVPDYVFEPSYNLMSIDNLQNYISKNQHLPNVPDMNNRKSWAKLSLQDRDMLLLEKTEENTLYIVDNYNQIKEQQIQITGITNNQNRITEQLTGQLADQNLTVSEKLNIIGKNLDNLNNEQYDKQIKKIKEQIADNTGDIAILESQYNTLQQQLNALSDFLTISDGVYDLKKGILKAADIDVSGSVIAESFAVKATDADTKTVGQAVICQLDKIYDSETKKCSECPAGEKCDGKSIVIKTKAVSQNSRILLTPREDLQGNNFWVADIKEDKSFTIKISEAIDEDVIFNWWIVEEK